MKDRLKKFYADREIELKAAGAVVLGAAAFMTFGYIATKDAMYSKGWKDGYHANDDSIACYQKGLIDAGVTDAREVLNRTFDFVTD